jgi:hypothetical protein
MLANLSAELSAIKTKRDAEATAEAKRVRVEHEELLRKQQADDERERRLAAERKKREKAGNGCELPGDLRSHREQEGF